MEQWCRSALLGVALLALGCAPSRTLPPQLQGRWACDAPRYQGRSLLLGADSLSFGTGGTGSETFAVERFEAEHDPVVGIHYTIAYRAPGEGLRELRLYFEFGAPPSVKIGDRPERWQKVARY